MMVVGGISGKLVLGNNGARGESGKLVLSNNGEGSGKLIPRMMVGNQVRLGKFIDKNANV